MRTLAVGDIHGCSKALRSLIEAIDPQPDDRMIFLGDYVDRGPDSKGVIDQLLQLQRICETVFLLGNHEIMFRGALRGLDAQLWLQIGGRPTLTSYGGRLDNVHTEHCKFLENLLPYYEDEKNIYVHANYLADLALADQPEETLFWEHLSDRIPQPHVSGKHVFCGHTPQPRGKIGYFDYFTCLDTGCFAGYWLSAIDVNSGETWQFSLQGHRFERWKTLRRAWDAGRRFLRV